MFFHWNLAKKTNPAIDSPLSNMAFLILCVLCASVVNNYLISFIANPCTGTNSRLSIRIRAIQPTSTGFPLAAGQISNHSFQETHSNETDSFRRPGRR
jgi:hypothetical protein